VSESTTAEARMPDLDRPVFVLTCARSGSTLLRFILDTHPDLGCPAETGFADVCSGLTRVWAVLEGISSRGGSRSVQVRTTRAAAAIRGSIDLAVTEYLKRSGKIRWVDKSLDNAAYAGMLANLWPQARFICLTRHCMDVVASGIETGRWGVGGYGFTPYVARYPGNNVAAIAEGWLATTGEIVSFRQSFPDRCYAVRYEDLVTSPEPVAAGLLAFLGASPVPGITGKCFEVAHDATGPADSKIWYTTGVNSDSVGGGIRVPADMIPANLRDRINKTLGDLGYVPVTGDWNQQLSVSSLVAAAGGEADGAGPGANGHVPSPAAAAHIPVVTGERLREAAERWPHLRGRIVSVVFRVGPAERERAAWRIGGAGAGEGAVNGEADVTVVGDLPRWRSVLSGEVKLPSALMTGDLRAAGKGLTGPLSITDEIHVIAFLLGLGVVPGAVSGLAVAAAKAQREAGLIS
jgi:protein-tyrosine sulfotransferase